MGAGCHEEEEMEGIFMRTKGSSDWKQGAGLLLVIFTINKVRKQTFQ